jgi:uncharacterized protein
MLLLSVVAFSRAQTPSASEHTNRLIQEKSPYLLLHAHNPVNWYPWGSEAFEKSRREQKPIFLSIGYYTCHWCHVMERESYSNDDIAAVLNKYFVAIKVDREERPDIDRLYIAYVEATTGNGGWPLNVFLTSDLKPFLGGIYFGRDKLKTLLLKTADAWVKDHDKLTNRATRSAQELLQMVGKPLSAKGDLPPAILDKTFHQLASNYDRTNGGFGPAPKFPRPVALDFLLRAYSRSSKQDALEMTLFTLRSMARGGIHDQLGGGFHRYATDAQWRVPHFEKMLYDQAQLAMTYSHAYQITHDPPLAEVARDILDFSLREMQVPGGGFASALDADSSPGQGKPATEGAFYTWTKAEIDSVLGFQKAALFNYAYGTEPDGDIPPSSSALENVLCQSRTPDEISKHLGLSREALPEQLESARKALVSARSHRPRPLVDDKVVTAWNGMMLATLAHASQILNEPRYLEAAESTASFLQSHLYDPKKKHLWRSYRAGGASVEGVLDDYTDLIHGLLELYQADFDVHWLRWALALQEKQDELFWDEQHGGYFDTTSGDTSLLARTHEAYDGAEPAPNSTAIMNLLLLGQITDRNDLRDKARRTLAAFGALLAANPEALPAMASALDFSLASTRQIVIAGDPAAQDTHDLLRLVHQRFLPNKVLLLVDGGPGEEQLSRWLPFIASAHRIQGKATVYICENYACKLPTSDPRVAESLLAAPP